MNLLHPAELCILYVWAEAAITIEIVRGREMSFFPTQVKKKKKKKKSHTPTQTQRALWRVIDGEMDISAFSVGFISQCFTAF